MFFKKAPKQPPAPIYPAYPKPIRASIASIVQDCISKPSVTMDSSESQGIQAQSEAIDYLANFSRFIGYQACAALSSHWLINNACMIPVQDALRKGWRCVSDIGTDEIQAIESFLRKIAFKSALQELGFGGRVFGSSIMLPIVDSPDKDYYELPFDINGVTKDSLKRVAVINPTYITPLVASGNANVLGQSFYEPEFWQVSGKKIHKSHLTIYRNSIIPQILKPLYLYGGIPLTQIIFEKVFQAETASSELTKLMRNMRLLVRKIAPEELAFNSAQVVDRLNLFADIRNNFGTHLIGDSESIEQIDSSLTGFDDLVKFQYELVASAAQIPVPKLMKSEISGGLGNEGKGEESIYQETLESIQENYTPGVERVYEICYKSLTGNNPPSLEVIFNPAYSESASELADIEMKKAQTHDIYVSMGAISPDNVYDVLFNDPDNLYNLLDSERPVDAGIDGQDEKEMVI
ncbi:MAG: DUF1073 domain-containing protein [Rickettsiales bacterium]